MLKRLEGLLLCGFSCVLFNIILSGRYSLYMNPKYLWMTAVSAALVMIYGVHGLFRADRGMNRLFAAVILIFILLTVFVPARELGVDDMLFSPF